MQTITFDFRGTHRITVPDGEIYQECVADIVSGKCYPIPKYDNGLPVRSIVDLGAHAGEFTIMAAIRWPEATIHAYEPNPYIVPLLTENCRPYKNIRIYPQAVDVKARRDTLYFNEIGSVAATVVRPAKPLPDKSAWAGIEVEIVGVDTVLAHKPDILKLDIEGPEGVVLEAMKDGLASINRIYVEYHHENIRRHIDDLLFPTHSLWYCHITRQHQGELMYLRKEV